MPAVTKDQILASARKFLPRPIEVPELGTVYVRPLSLDGYARLNQAQASKDTAQVAVVLISEGICDEQGKPLFGADDAEAIRALPMTICDLLVGVVQDASAITEGVEHASGNSEPTR